MPFSSKNISPVVVIKLGGSLITHKHRDSSFCRQRTRRLAREIAATSRQTVVVHGTGSFGKPPAIRYMYDADGLLPDARGEVVAEVATLLHVLRGHVLACLEAEGLRPFGLAAASLYRTRQGQISGQHLADVSALLERSMTPVISGDLVLDENGGFAVCSSDAIAAHLAVHLAAERLIFATDTPVTVPSEEGRRRVATELFADDPRTAGSIQPTARDVSGGMFGKLTSGFQATRAGVETLIVDGRVPHRIRNAIVGLPVPATRLRADP